MASYIQAAREDSCLRKIPVPPGIRGLRRYRPSFPDRLASGCVLHGGTGVPKAADSYRDHTGRRGRLS